MMEDKQVKTVDALFREGLSEARVQPRPELWDKIQSQVQQREPVQVPVPWGWWMAAAAIGVLFALGIHLAWQPPVATESALAQNQNPPTQMESVVPSPTSDEMALVAPFSLKEEGETPSVNTNAGSGFNANPPQNNQLNNHTPKPEKKQIQPVFAAAQVAEENEFRAFLHDFAPNPVQPKGVSAKHSAQLRNGMSLDFPYEFDENARGFDLNALAFGEEEGDQAPKSRWKLGGLFSPDMAMSASNIAIPGSSQDRTGMAVPQSLEESDLPSVAQTRSVAFSSGFQLGYAISEHFELNTGVTYATRTSGFGQPEAYPFNAEDASVAAYASSPTSNDYTHTYLEVPMTVRLHLLPKRKVDLFLTSGASSQLFIENEQRAHYQGFSDARLESAEVGTLTPYRFNALAGVGVEYAFNDHLSMNVEPLIRKEIYSDPVVSIANPDLSMSLRTGVNYRF